MRFWTAIALLFVTTISYAGNYVVITHSPMPEMDESETKKIVKQLFLKQRDTLPNNERSMALMPRKNAASYPPFLENVLMMTPQELDAYWKIQRTHKAASPPREVNSDRLMVHLVKNTLGAIGIVPKAAYEKYQHDKVNMLLEF